MTAAWAAEAAEAAAGHAAVPFYASGEFWVAIAFVIFVALTARTIYRVVTVALDDRAERIKAQIDEATRLAEEAQELLLSYQQKQRDAAKEAEDILHAARNEADRFGDRARLDLENALARREQLAMDRIAQAEAQAVTEVRTRAVDVAMEASRRVLAEQAKGKTADALIDAAIKELPEKLKLH